MSGLVLFTLTAAVLLLSAVALFFFSATRGALLVRSALGQMHLPAAHVYPIYSNLRLMRLVDCQPLISAILLFQYERLVSMITDSMSASDLRGRDVLITSCAFGNMMPRVVETSIRSGARKVMIVDIVRNELEHARHKLPALSGQLEFLEVDAMATQLAAGSVAANVVFFLLHELPDTMKVQVLQEAVRVTAPGGRLYIAEFHKPEPWVMRAMSWMYFTVFEPLGIALWERLDPVRQLDGIGGLRCERRTVCLGNFQVVVATKT